MKYKLFLDDERVPMDCTKFVSNTTLIPIYQETEWIIARTFEQFKSMVTKFGIPTFVSFDHDLADGKGDKEKTGLDCVKWMVEYCMDNKVEFPRYAIHSQNNVGPDNMDSYIKNYLKHK